MYYYASSRGCRTCRSGSFDASGHEVPVFPVLVQVVHDETAASDHLVAVGADHLQRALDQFRGDAAPAQGAWSLGMGDDDGLRRWPVIGKGDLALGIELEAVQGLV